MGDTEISDEEKARLRADERVRWFVYIAMALIFVIPGLFAVRTFQQRSWTGARWFEEATRKAKSWAPDAELVDIYSSSVDPSGLADVRHRGHWRFEFRSPSREAAARSTPQPARIPGAPPPAPAGPTCGYQYVVGAGVKGGFMISDNESHLSDGCGVSLPSTPACTVTQVWDRAVAKGAPRPGFADIVLLTTAKGREWSFKIPNLSPDNVLGDPSFKTTFPDDCSAAQ